MWLKIKLIQAFMVVLVSCKNEEDPFKNEGARAVTTDLSFLWDFFQTLKGRLILLEIQTVSSQYFSHYKSMGTLQGQLTPQSLV